MAYPNLSIDPDATSFNETSENVAIASGDTEGGYIYTRPRFTRRPRRTFTFVHKNISEAERITLQNFWDANYGGSNSFNWTHPITSVVYTVRFAPDMELTFDRIGFGTNHRWNTEAIVLKEV